MQTLIFEVRIDLGDVRGRSDMDALMRFYDAGTEIRLIGSQTEDFAMPLGDLYGVPRSPEPPAAPAPYAPPVAHSEPWPFDDEMPKPEPVAEQAVEADPEDFPIFRSERVVARGKVIWDEPVQPPSSPRATGDLNDAAEIASATETAVQPDPEPAAPEVAPEVEEPAPSPELAAQRDVPAWGDGPAPSGSAVLEDLMRPEVPPLPDHAGAVEPLIGDTEDLETIVWRMFSSGDTTKKIAAEFELSEKEVNAILLPIVKGERVDPVTGKPYVKPAPAQVTLSTTPPKPGDKDAAGWSLREDREIFRMKMDNRTVGAIAKEIGRKGAEVSQRYEFLQADLGMSDREAYRYLDSALTRSIAHHGL